MWRGAPPLVLLLIAIERCGADGELERPLDINQVRMWHQYLQERRINATKQTILDKLNYVQPPNVTRWPSQAEMDRVVQSPSVEGMLSDAPIGGKDAAKNSCRALLSTKYTFPLNDPPGMKYDYWRTYFNLANMSDYEVTNATLYFYVTRPPDVQGDFKYKVRVYKYLSEAALETDPIAEGLRMLIGTGDWGNINITEMVRHWSKTPHKNYGLMIKAEREMSADQSLQELDDQQQDNILRTRKQGSNSSARMFLEIEVKEEILKFDADSVQPNDCSLEPLEYRNKCCRFPLRVDFESFGWDWIIAPKRYDAYYCAGQCTFSHLPAHVHSHLTQQKRLLKGLSGPCCNPQDMLGMKIVYIDSTGNIRDRIIENMIVQRCGCA